MLLVCKEFGYTEDEYNSNSIEFNIKAGYLLSAEAKASKVPQTPSRGRTSLPGVRTSIRRN